MTRNPEPQAHRKRMRTPPAPSRGVGRRVFWLSMAASGVLHLLGIFIYPALMTRTGAVPPAFGPGAAPLPPEGTELINLEELPPDADLNVLPPEEEEEPLAPEAPAPTQGGGVERGEDPGDAEGPSGVSAAERLRPRAGDLRLWAPVDPEITALSDEELMQLLLNAEIEELSDSAALAAELARRMTDWTYTGEDGKRWGVSPGKIHLGDITIPMPFGFSAPPSVREENADRLWAWDDIQRGAAAKGVRDSWRDRAEAIRRRKDAERRPDTTGIRR